MTSFWDIGILAAGLLGGFIAVHFHYPAAFLVASAAGAAALATTFAVRGSPPAMMQAAAQTIPL